ncbi:hypothetical protein BWI93_20040 [Siphonobacter sp. BAB-5385]|uniref:DUF6427 family protein n=1 Tax=Siphonobacter sp. BAB-5385 TaxID=1864822 RepID=UPI000B9E974A|nr:DUF6427 family protein [Siphonobacter sp. BAB-5385]OZI06463.1 hypothetical protein BWI93_20040 [Siphonobacter sp. BAB-5385]
MLSFFRVNAAYQLFVLLVILFLVRLPVLMGTTPLLIPEMQWTLLGEQLSKGHGLYDGIWDSTAPMAAAVYAGLHWIFGRSEVMYHFVAYAIAAFQMIYFNLIMSRQSVFADRNYVPGFIYLVLMNLSFDYTTLSPALLATTFLLLALGTMLKQLDREGIRDELLEVGFYIGIATLFYPPCMVFILWAVLALLLYSGASFRQHIMNILGFLFPLVIVNLYFYLDGRYDAFTRNFLSIIFQIRQYDLNDFQTLITVLILPVILAGLGFLQILKHGRYTNFQSRVQQVMALYLGACLLSVGLMAYLAPMQFVIFTPGLAFFSVYFFETYTRRRWIPEMMFVIFVGGVGILFYLTLLPAFSNTILKLENLTVQPVRLPSEIKNKRILVLGDGMGEYLENYPATAYLNWNLARFDLENLNNYNNVINILRNFEKDPPEYLIDRRNLAPTLFKRIPALARQYEQIDKGIYRKIHA